MKVQELTEAEIGLITDALLRLREVKVQAHDDIVKVPGHERFKPADFGIPMIDELVIKLEGEDVDEKGDPL